MQVGSGPASGEIAFVPQTGFWKKKSKVVSKFSKAPTLNPFLKGVPSGNFMLVQSEDIQKELINIFKAFLKVSEFVVQRKNNIQIPELKTSTAIFEVPNDQSMENQK